MSEINSSVSGVAFLHKIAGILCRWNLSSCNLLLIQNDQGLACFLCYVRSGFSRSDFCDVSLDYFVEYLQKVFNVVLFSPLLPLGT